MYKFYKETHKCLNRIKEFGPQIKKGKNKENRGNHRLALKVRIKVKVQVDQ